LFPDLPHCNDFHASPDDSHKTHSSDAPAKGHLFDTELNAKLNFKVNDSNNNNNNNNNTNSSSNGAEGCDGKEKDEMMEVKEEVKGCEINGTRDDSPKIKSETKDSENCISQFLNSIINFRRDEMNLSLNNLLTGGGGGGGPNVPSNFLLNDLNRNFLTSNFSGEHVSHALSNLVAGHQQYQKYGRGTCKWPGCDLIFDDLQTFTKWVFIWCE
jgi:hypothetical protein